ncbi:MAG TPA: hypothetical protein VIQ24_18410 [Pyrinomonadaceae bacterium]
MPEEDLQLLITLDDPWNAQECDMFNNRQAEHSVMHRPDQPGPTRERHDHRAEEFTDIDSYKLTSNTTDGEEHQHDLF